MFGQAAAPALVATVIAGQLTHQHTFYHAQRDGVKANAIQKAWEDSEDDGWYHRPMSPGLHEVTGS